jgi:hypothetical protein
MKLFDDSPAEKAYKVAKFGVFAALGAVIVMFFSAIRTILKGPNSK